MKVRIKTTRLTISVSVFIMGIGVLKAQNTGIHTQNPTETLDVGDGNLRIREIPVHTGDYEQDLAVVADTDGVLKTVNAVMPKFFYMPSIIIPTAADQAPPGDIFGEIDLHELYNEQFSGTGTPGLVENPGSTTSLPVLAINELDYYITWYDDGVFENVTLDNSGLLTYDIASGADVTIGSFMNIVFVVK